VEVCGYALAFLLLEADRSVQQHLLLIKLHFLQLHLKAYYFPLVKNNENDEPDGERKHGDSAKEKHGRHFAVKVGNL
jgi:hypothetical protein